MCLDNSHIILKKLKEPIVFYTFWEGQPTDIVYGKLKTKSHLNIEGLKVYTFFLTELASRIMIFCWTNIRRQA